MYPYIFNTWVIQILPSFPKVCCTYSTMLGLSFSCQKQCGSARFGVSVMCLHYICGMWGNLVSFFPKEKKKRIKQNLIFLFLLLLLAEFPIARSTVPFERHFKRIVLFALVMGSWYYIIPPRRVQYPHVVKEHESLFTFIWINCVTNELCRGKK